MVAELRYPRSIVGVSVDVPDAHPSRCETCRSYAVSSSGYCSELCRLFDEAHGELVAAYEAADCDRTDPAVVRARTALRAVAAVYDAELRRGANRGRLAGHREWAADVRAGELAPVRFRAACAVVRARAGIGPRS